MATFRPTMRVARVRQPFNLVDQVIHDMNDPKRNPVPRRERRAAQRKQKRGL